MFVIFRNPSRYMKQIFEGYSDENVILDNDFGGVISIINDFHNSISINEKVQLPLKCIWYNKYLDYKKLDKCQLNNEMIYFVFFEGNRLAYQQKYLSYLRRKYPNAKFIFRFINIVKKENKLYLSYIKNNFDLIVSMDMNDCKKYNFLYVYNTYYYDYSKVEKEYEGDVIFLGSNKGRIKILEKIYFALTKSGIKCNFYISGVQPKDQNTCYSGLNYIQNMKYDKYINKLTGSRYILEIVNENQVGSTLRTIEAIWFDKILITNNKSIEKEDFFNKEKCIVIEKMEDLKKINLSLEPKTAWRRELIEHEYLFMKIKNYFENE